MARGQSSKRRRLSPPADGGDSELYTNDDEWGVEQDYERRPRKTNKKDSERTRLPIKTSEGFVQAKDDVEEQMEDSDSFLGTDDDEMEDGSGEEEEEEEEEEKPKIPIKVQIMQAKEDLARMASQINEDPEENIALFKTMAEMADNPDSPLTVKKLALAAQAALYKDVIPGYRIRPLSEEDKTAKVSKDVRKLRDFEQSLVSGYKNYVNKLAQLAKPGRGHTSEKDASLKTMAINCACSLLQAVPHFNFRSELIKIIINRLARRLVDPDMAKCRETVEDVFAKDIDGIVSLETVRLLSKMMKARDFRIHESVLDTFLHLRLLGEFTFKASTERVDREEPEEPVRGKKQKQKREFRTKKERKVMKERKVVEKDMKQADALVSHEERDKNQAETLKLVFGNYFRILKQRIPHLMGPVLEGLAKYARLINQDFFGDLLEALKDLIGHAEREDQGEDEGEDEEEDESKEGAISEAASRDSRRETLLCTVTAFALLDGQDTAKAATTLHLDLSYFIKHLYRSLYALSTNPEVEFNPNTSLRLPDPNSPEESSRIRSKNKVNFQTPMVLLLRCLQSILLSRAHGNPPPVRLASFSKRLMTSSLQLPEKSALATLSLMQQVSRHHGRRISPLWHTDERKGDGVFNAYSTDIEGTNVFAGSVWEGELLRQHYCPQVRDAAIDIEKMLLSSK
jgi:nucleolar complex protein 3